MKVNFTGHIKDLSGVDIVDTNGKPVEFKKVCIDALLTPTETPMEGTEHLQRFQLAQAINTGVAEIKAPEVTLLLACLNEMKFSPLVYGRVSELIQT